VQNPYPLARQQFRRKLLLCAHYYVELLLSNKHAEHVTLIRCVLGTSRLGDPGECNSERLIEKARRY